MKVLEYFKEKNFITKSGLMVGLGESEEELEVVFERLAEAEVDFLTIGQYLQPTLDHFPLQKYYRPEDFRRLALKAREIGIPEVFSGPFVRSSYMAHREFNKVGGKK